MIRTIIFSFLFTLGFSHQVFSQKIADQVVAVVGDKAILQSEIEEAYLQYKSEGVKLTNLKCRILEDILVQKLMINQAEVDSILVSEAQVEMQLEQRLRYYEEMIGGPEKLLEYFNKKTRLDVKNDLRDMIRDQLITQQMQSTITEGIKITPSETHRFYKSLSKDSIPFINSTVELQQIAVYPSFSDEAIYEVRKKLLDLRKRIIEGDKFSTLAVLYSEGPSSVKGGDIGCMAKAELDPVYSKAAFGLKVGSVSNIIKSSFGYHIIQLYERKDMDVCTRHILIRPHVSLQSMQDAISTLDSISRLVRLDSLTFDQAAIKLSEDDNTKANGGLLINPETGSSKFEMEELTKEDYNAIRNLKLGEISDPYKTIDENVQVVFKISKLQARTDPHRANLKDDYQTIQELAMANKKQTEILEWIIEKQESTYIVINKSMRQCTFSTSGWIK